MRSLLLASILLLLAAPLSLADTQFESWEDTYTVLSMSGTGSPPLIAEIRAGVPIDPVHGTQSLLLINNSPTGTPKAYVAWIRGLVPDDVVDVSFYLYDNTPDELPSGRIWAHWNYDPDDVDVYSYDAGGYVPLTSGTGWEQLSWSWTVGPNDFNVGLVIEVELHGALGDSLSVDAMQVTAPDHADITTHQPPVPVESRTWGAIKSLYR